MVDWNPAIWLASYCGPAIWLASYRGLKFNKPHCRKPCPKKSRQWPYPWSIDDYAKNGGQGKVWLLWNFYHGSLRTWFKTIVNKLAISNHTALILGVRAFRSYLKLFCEYELHSLPNKKVSGAKDHGKNYIKVRPPLVRHLLCNRLLSLRHLETFWHIREKIRTLSFSSCF